MYWSSKLEIQRGVDLPEPHPDADEFQLRSETTGLQFFENLEDACEAAHKDMTVWKISYQGLTGRVRVELC